MGLSLVMNSCLHVICKEHIYLRKYKMFLWKFNNSLHLLIFGVSKMVFFFLPLKFYNPVNLLGCTGRICHCTLDFFFQALSKNTNCLPSYLYHHTHSLRWRSKLAVTLARPFHQEVTCHKELTPLSSGCRWKPLRTP